MTAGRGCLLVPLLGGLSVAVVAVVLILADDVPSAGAQRFGWLFGAAVLVMIVGGGAAVVLNARAAYRQARRMRRADNVQCTECGYDLRASHEHGRCPECGTPFDPERVW